MLTNIWHNEGDGELYRETAMFIDSEPRPGIVDVAAFLRDRAKLDTITLVVGQFIVAALFEGRHADLLYWAMIAAEAGSSGVEQFPAEIQAELAGYLKRGFAKVVTGNLPH